MKSVKLLLGAAFACGIGLSGGITASNAATYTLSACNGGPVVEREITMEQCP